MHVPGIKKCILTIILILLLVFSFITANCEDDSRNLLYNGDFEIVGSDGLPDGWFTDAYLMDPGYSVYAETEGMDGEESRAVSIHNTALNDARFAQTVQVEPDSIYCLSGYIRAENISGGHGANLSVEGVYAFSEKVYDTNGEWQYIEYYGETGPDQYYITVFARIGGYSGESKGTVFFDRLSLTETEDLPEDIVVDRWYVNPVSYAEADDNWGDVDETETPAGPAWP